MSQAQAHLPPYNPIDPFGGYHYSTIQWIRVHLLTSTMNDTTVEGFQRDRGKNGKAPAPLWNRVKELAKVDFDPRIFTPRIISQRDDGTYFTIDGNGSNHWVEQLFDNPNMKVPCVVLTGLTLADEADLFEKAQRGRLVTKAVQFDAAVHAERVDALEITEILGDYGAVVGTGRKPHIFGQSAIRYNYDRNGAAGLRQVIAFIKQNFWDDPYSSNIGFVKALGDILNMKGYETDKLAQALKGLNIVELFPGGSGTGFAAQTSALQGMKTLYHNMWGEPVVEQPEG
jgi:hypothetical protein